MKMKTQPGRAIFVTSGNGYHADEKGIIHNVLGDDANDLRHAGAEIYDEPPVAAPIAAPAAPAVAPPKPAAPPAPAAAPVKNDAPPAA